MASRQLHFYDAADPRNVPSGSHAGVYKNGFVWPQSEIDRMAAIFGISVEQAASWARVARCLDIESGAARPQDLPPFVEERWRLGYDDATGYVNRSNWLQAYDAVHEAKIREPLWWVSTLDGTQNVELKNSAGVVLARAWAVQYFGGPTTAFDLSVLHGINNFHRP